MSDDLIPWLRAQLDEDERGVRAAFSSQYDWEEGWGAEPSNGAFVITPHVGIIHEEVQAAHIERWNPARVLAEVEAKRRILAEVPCTDLSRDGHCQTAKLLALPYADRPGYREEWRP